jgi:hypothetical protein
MEPVSALLAASKPQARKRFPRPQRQETAPCIVEALDSGCIRARSRISSSTVHKTRYTSVSLQEKGKEAGMTKVVLDGVMRSKLHDLAEPLELCDESGRVLGRVFPTLDLSQYEPWEPPISEEELWRCEEETESYTTAEVLAYLEKEST